MASIKRHPKSPYWMACFRLPDGRRTVRSTGTTNRKEALRIALKFEDASGVSRSGKLSETRARKTIADIYALGNEEELGSSTISVFLENWIKRKQVESESATAERYSAVIKRALAVLGHRANRDLSVLASKDIVEIRDKIAAELSASSANFAIKVLRAALNQARRDGLVDTNVASQITLVKKGGKGAARRPFTMDELKRILAVASQEWQGIILTGLYTGLRLGDVVRLTWANLDLQRRKLSVATRKTDRRVVLPIAERLLRYFEELPASDNPAAPLFPEAFSIVEQRGLVSMLSRQFYDILVAAGLAEKRTHAGAGKGRSSKRATNNLSFHCLRHTATSLLKNAGVSDVVARDIIGHDSVAVSAHYTHIDVETKRRAIDALPEV